MKAFVFVSLKRKVVRFLIVGLLLGIAIAHLSQSLAQVTAATKSELVDVQNISLSIRLDMRYATTNNFTKRKLYSQAKCVLQTSVAAQLARVQSDLEKRGLGLKVFDCYRPLSVQKKLWQLVPDPNYVADPARGSRHNRGSAVDITLVNSNGEELLMPSEFDDFSERSHLNYNGGSAKARQNRQTLQQAMKKRGFIPLETEWWHFDAANWQQYPVLDISLEKIN